MDILVENYVVLGAFVLGVATRMLAPWLVKIIAQLRSGGNKKIMWDWRYLYGQGLAAALVLLLTPLLIEDFAGLVTGASWQTAWITGYVVSDFGRLIDKVVSVK